MKNLLEAHWHHLPTEEVVDLLDSNAQHGLDTFEVVDRHNIYGPNQILQKQGSGPLLRFLLQFHQALIYILLAAALITGLLQEWVDSAVIMGVVLVNTTIGFLQESKALQAIDALARTMSSEATVLRSGEKMKIPAEQLVPGDVVILQSGDKVPADLRLVKVRELQVDESSLTGESLAVIKQSDQLPHDTALADRLNMAYMSSLVTYGSAQGVVVAISDQTELGQISEMISSAEILATPLTRKIAQFSKLLLYVILFMALLTFVVGAIRGESLFDMFMAAVALAVGAIPEGLPAAVTITLAIGMGQMARRKAIIRRLPAVETLGSTTVICSDKTGTLTRNEMTVQQLWAGGDQYQVSGTGYSNEGEVTCIGRSVDLLQQTALQQLLLAGLLCNDSALRKVESGWKVEGDPTEAALLVVAPKAGFDIQQKRAQWQRLDAIPFESQHQYMATLYKELTTGELVIYIKGSVESILSRSKLTLHADGSLQALDSSAIEQQVENVAKNGLRVLAFAMLPITPGVLTIDHKDVASGLVFLGLQGMMDPPREEAIRAVHACQQAGIKVKMITGDHAVTAAAISNMIGLDAASKGGPVSILKGHELEQFNDQDLITAAAETVVFARVTPAQKLRLVEALQAGGEVVAMTGDGVNDAPALRRADIGIAMGISGTEVSREAADMVLADDNFSSIEAAVEEGRGVFDNLVKFITWTLPTNLGEGLVIMAAVLLGVTLPILPVQILWINMTTAALLGLMLAFEPKEKNIMQRAPRNPSASILSTELIVRIFLVGVLLLVSAFGLFYWTLEQGYSLEEARTVAVNMFVFGELFYLFNCRSLSQSLLNVGFFSNLWLLVGVLMMVLLQLLFTYQSTMNELFQSAPIGGTAWLLILILSMIIHVVVEVVKWFYRPAVASHRL